MKVLQRVDIDPILYCQLVDMCKVEDCTGQCANITEIVPDPQEGYEGATTLRAALAAHSAQTRTSCSTARST